jgi:hypothetical protein
MSLILLYGVLFTSALSVCLADEQAGVPLIVNRQNVSPAEFTWFMEQERAGVFQYFKTTCNLENGKEFWTHECAGTTPRALLQQRTIDRVVREKVEQILFQELGLIQDIRYASFLENLETLNRQRETAAQGGEPIYGPVRFTQLQFFGHWKASLQLEAKKKLAQGKLAPTEEELREYYRETKENFRTPVRLTLEVINLQPLTGLPTNAIQSELSSGQTAREILQHFGDRKDVRVSTRRFDALDADRIGELFSAARDITGMTSLQPGQCVTTTGPSGAVEIVKCISRTAPETPPFEAVRGRIEVRYLDRQYERLVADAVKAATVQTDLKVIDKLLPAE